MIIVLVVAAADSSPAVPRWSGGPAERLCNTALQPWQPGRSGFM
jgi:hypothetical protein